MTSQSTDADVLLLPAMSELPHLLAQLHQLFEEHDPRVVMIDRDQGTIMALPRGAVVVTEFTELSLGVLLQQTAIQFVDTTSNPLVALRDRAARDGVTPHTFCANTTNQPELGIDDKERVLWTSTVSPGNLLLACQSAQGWKLYGCNL